MLLCLNIFKAFSKFADCKLPKPMDLWFRKETFGLSGLSISKELLCSSLCSFQSVLWSLITGDFRPETLLKLVFRLLLAEAERMLPISCFQIKKYLIAASFKLHSTNFKTRITFLFFSFAKSCASMSLKDSCSFCWKFSLSF